MRRRDRAESEFRRRNIFELYIEEVVEACNRLKGGKLPKEKLKAQLQKIASSRTGGTKTDEVLGKTGTGPEGLPHSIVVTAEGVEGELSVVDEAAAATKPLPSASAAPVAEGDADDDRAAPEAPAEKASRKGGKLGKERITKGAQAANPKGKAAQLPLFSGDGPTGKRTGSATGKSGKTRGAKRPPRKEK
jgi:DNA topoisomerase-6 subunit B